MTSQLVLTDDRGAILGHPLAVGGWSYSIVRHDVGALEVRLPEEWADSLAFENRIEVWRRLPQITAVLVRSYFIQSVEEMVDASTRGVLAVTAVDANALLKWRDVEAAKGSANASKTDHADDLLRAFVRLELVTTDPLDASYFTVEADTHSGPSLTVDQSWANLLQACQEIADEADGQGSPVYWEIADLGSCQYQFRVATGQLGDDHSAGSAVPLGVGLDYGNVSSLTISQDASAEVNHVIARGSGEGTAAVTGESIGTGATRSVWSRKKKVTSENDLATTALCNAAAARVVAASKPRLRVTAELAEAPGFRFGYDWNHGDKLTVSHRRAAYTAHVNAVRISVGADGRETLDSVLEVEAS